MVEKVETRRLRPLLIVAGLLVLLAGGFAAYRVIARSSTPDPEKLTCRDLQDLDAAEANYDRLVRRGGTSGTIGVDLTELRDLADRFSDLAGRLARDADLLAPRDGEIVAARVRALADQVRLHATGINSFRQSNPVGVEIARADVATSFSCSAEEEGARSADVRLVGSRGPAVLARFPQR